MKKVLFISHGHPDFSKGGAEVASYSLFREYLRQGGEAMYLARVDHAAHGGSLFSRWKSDHEVLFHTRMSDFFLFGNANKEETWSGFADFLERYKPEVVHLHHYIHIGVEILKVIRNVLPDVRIVLTLHEYFAICNHNGQMVKRNEGRFKLCYAASPVECQRCFPEKGAADFFLRELYLKRMFEEVDHFVSPSHFLIDRYVNWGLPREKMTMIENGQFSTEPLAPRLCGEGEYRSKFAFFGQLNPYKGIDVLLEAVASIPKSKRKKLGLKLDIYGANLEIQPPDFQKRINELIEAAGKSVAFHGPYESSEQRELMKGTDWIIIPSIWWENSPMVIQEALNNGRPLIASNIGGMKEKVHEDFGLHFLNKNASQLADAMKQACEPEVWNEKYKKVKAHKVVSTEQCFQQHREVYERKQAIRPVRGFPSKSGKKEEA